MADGGQRADGDQSFDATVKAAVKALRNRQPLILRQRLDAEFLGEFRDLGPLLVDRFGEFF
jgi:hypothetical protein